MRTVLTLALLLLAAMPALPVQTQRVTEQQKSEAKKELDGGGDAFKQGRYADAQLHFERARALDPTQTLTAFLIAGAIASQYKPGVGSPENVAKAREAIAAYQRFLELEPPNDVAYDAVTYLLRLLKDEEQGRLWVLRRATDAGLPAGKRAEAYLDIAGDEWLCAYSITALSENKRTVMRGGQSVVERIRPRDRGEYDKSVRCAERGLEFVEQAIGLDPDSDRAWAHKTNLLFEMMKLAEMDGDWERSDSYERRAAEARRIWQELDERNRKRREAEEEKMTQEGEGRPDPPK
jgi:tetratricopeptide (TPR) repeat protein